MEAAPRTHVGLRPPVFKFSQVFCVWLRVVRSDCAAWGFLRLLRSGLCVWLRPFSGCVGKSLANDAMTLRSITPVSPPPQLRTSSPALVFEPEGTLAFQLRVTDSEVDLQDTGVPGA